MSYKNPEYIVAQQVANYLRYQYPGVLFHFDLAGLNLSRAQAGMMKAIQGERGFPDLMILESRKGFSGLFLELKTDKVKLFKKDGVTFVSEHLEAQYSMHARLKIKGYEAYFVFGFEEARKEIDNYLKQ